MDRRDVLKRFGIGAIVAPIIGGAVDRSSAAELIEIPKVKPVELFSRIPEPIELRNVVNAQIVLQFADGTSRTIAIDRPYSRGRMRPDQPFYVAVEFMADVSPATTVGEIRGLGDLA